MSSDDLIVARDFLFKGMPWDLSRPRFMDFQREHLRQKTETDPLFREKLRQVAIEALGHYQPEVIQRGLIALTFVGTSVDLPMIEALLSHNHSGVSKDAQTCLFEIAHHAGTQG
jgi:hypothetical protein